MTYVPKCHFCGSTKKIKVPEVGISFSLGGADYNFCELCLTGMSADEFWEEMFKREGYDYPPKLAEWAQEAVDQGLDPSDLNVRWPGSRGEKVSDGRTPRRQTSSTNKERERRKMTNSLRYKIMRKDKFHCVLCGATGKDTELVVDHIIPIAKDGKTIESNLRTLCMDCNSGKGTKLDTDTS